MKPKKRILNEHRGKCIHFAKIGESVKKVLNRVEMYTFFENMGKLQILSK